MQFSVPELKRIYGYLNPTTAVFPNQISIVPPERKSKNRKEIIIGWGGSHGHFEDIAEVSGPLIDWIIRRDNIRLYLMCSDPIWLLFNSLPNAKKRRFKPGSLSDYYAFLTKLDIGLAPLKNTAFNRSRSDIKFLEYAAHGVVPVLQALVPYDSTARHGETGFLFKDGPELLSVLEILTVNKNGDLLSKTAKSSRKYVLMERLQNYHSGERIGFYRDQLGRLQRGQREKKTVCGIFKDLSGIEGVVRNDRHLRLMPTNFERLLHDGLVLSQLEGKTDLARSIFLKASQLEPANYLPYLFGASCSGDAIDWLNSAIERNPDSLKSWTMLGEEYSKKGDPINAVRCFDSAAKIFSDYEIPYLRTAALLNTVGHYKESHFLAQKARALISSLEA